MKTDTVDPWSGADVAVAVGKNCFEDSFVSVDTGHEKLSDSEQYLQKLYTRLKRVQGGTSKKDLVNSLSEAKEDCIARLITSDCNIKTEEEAELVSNPLIRHIAPHLQALTATELIHLLKADVLQVVADREQLGENKE
ncbi:hypothetical protein KM043_001473 [Ampulex compressa]|nr:hypothetical protein KM043_001473 [Ampulex compressa]